MTALAPRPKTRRRDAFSPLSVLEKLATPHGLDRYLELVNPMLTVRELRAEVTAVHRPTADSVRLTLRPTRQWQGFQAGQYIQLTVEIDGVYRTRCFSPAGSQYRADGRIELTVKAHGGGLVSGYLYANARPGLVVGLAQADGEFRLPTRRPDRVLFVSGGSGITPVLSMLRTLLDEGHTGELVFLHYNRSVGDVAYLPELRELAARHDNLRLLFAYPESGDGDLEGNFGSAHLQAAAPWFADAQTFLCGPAGLMDAVRAHYAQAGAEDTLHWEAFTLAAVNPDAEDATGELTFGRSDRRAANSGASLLEQAEAAGLTPEYGCRMGICFSCTQVKTSGCTRNVRTGETNSDPDTEIQLCINVPVGDVTLDI